MPKKWDEQYLNHKTGASDLVHVEKISFQINHNWGWAQFTRCLSFIEVLMKYEQNKAIVKSHERNILI